MTDRTRRHLEAILSDVLPTLKDGEPVVVGAAALTLGGEALDVVTMDVDLAVALDMERIVAALEGTAWSREPRLEHRWSRPMMGPTTGSSSPLRGLLDIVPTTPSLLRAGRILWPESGAEMTLAGMEAARSCARQVTLSDGSRVKLAAPGAIMMLKLIALDEAGMARSKDLDHVCVLLERYQRDSERCFTPDLLELELPYPLVPAWLLGRDVGAIAHGDDRARVLRGLEWLMIPDSSQLLLAARRGPASWNRRPEPLLDRLAAFAAGLGAAEPAEGAP